MAEEAIVYVVRAAAEYAVAAVEHMEAAAAPAMCLVLEPELELLPLHRACSGGSSSSSSGIAQWRLKLLLCAVLLLLCAPLPLLPL